MPRKWEVTHMPEERIVVRTREAGFTHVEPLDLGYPVIAFYFVRA